MPNADLSNVGATPRSRTRRRTARRRTGGGNSGILSGRTGAGTGIGGGSTVATGNLDFNNLNARDQRLVQHGIELGCRAYGNPVPGYMGGKATR